VNVSHGAARVYADALFDIAVQSNAVAQVADELHAVSAALGGLDPDLRAFFVLPQFRREDKARILDMAFQGKVGRPVLGLLHVLVQKRREALLDAVVEEFDKLKDQHEGRVRASVTTARQLDAELADALRRALERRTGKAIILQERVDPEVLGGIRVSVGDRVLDGTLRRGLQDMRRALAASQGRG
jgi:F-type H+-transporting ATPase subunit delta